MIRVHSPVGVQPGCRQFREFDEAALLQRARDGDVEAFGQLVDAHLAEIFGLSLMMLNHRVHAEDVAGQTFIAAWGNMPYSGTPAQLRIRLYRDCTSRCLSLAGAHRRRDSVAAASGGSRAGTRQFAALLQCIPPGLRACWLLREVHGLPDGQVARILAVDETAVSERASRARAELARQWHGIDSGLKSATGGGFAAAGEVSSGSGRRGTGYVQSMGISNRR